MAGFMFPKGKRASASSRPLVGSVDAHQALRSGGSRPWSHPVPIVLSQHGNRGVDGLWPHGRTCPRRKPGGILKEKKPGMKKSKLTQAESSPPPLIMQLGGVRKAFC